MKNACHNFLKPKIMSFFFLFHLINSSSPKDIQYTYNDRKAGTR